MLQSYIPERSMDEYSLIAEAQQFRPELAFEDLQHDLLQTLVQKEGIAKAMAVFYAKLIYNSRSQEFIKNLKQIEFDFSSLPQISGEVWVIPAGFYRDIPEFDGDGSLIRKICGHFGLNSRLVAVNPKGSVSENAEFIIAELCKHNTKPIIAFSISKGAADLRIALERRPDLQSKIQAWVCIGGLLRSNPIADAMLKKKGVKKFLQKSVMQLLGIPLEFLSEFSSKTGILNAELNIHIKQQISVIALPLASHMQGNILKRFKVLSRYGPNDGYTLSLDSVLPKGFVYPLWGADHYFRSSQLNETLYKIFYYLGQT
ncbi:MAG: hypothetical protein AAF518_09645 [Spirochaetota bacterium]